MCCPDVKCAAAAAWLPATCPLPPAQPDTGNLPCPAPPPRLSPALAAEYCFDPSTPEDPPPTLPLLHHPLARHPPGRWAQDTLARHAADPRPKVLPYSLLEAGATGDAFWDAAQRQLVKTGELQNNTRMTWGKAFLGWTPSPQAALSALLHANHRWALDGCDPASYSGVLWCFGMFDSPKASADTPVSGCLAIKSTAAAARRVPPIAYSQLAI